MNQKTKKIIPYFLTLIILIGVFGLAQKTLAQTTGGTANSDNILFLQPTDTTQSSGTILDAPVVPANPASAPITTTNTAPTSSIPTTAAATGTGSSSAFQKVINDATCVSLSSGSIPGCIKDIFYYLIYVPSAAILAVAAVFLDALLSISLSSTLFTGSTFIPTAWAVVRDLSNIFFILILLFVAIQLILDMGAHDAKKTIAKVIIIALLINFSMFFTQVVIDSSNILALIFYNKLDVTYKDSSGNVVKRPYAGATGPNEKDISGSMYNGFDPTSKLSQSFWDKTQETMNPVTGQMVHTESEVPAGTFVAVILLASLIMLFAAYAFFISGLAFVGRMIELWILIIFSPFAFMSFSVPFLSKTKYIGWSNWSSRLVETAFMAPIFMFFMYLIFLLLGANLFGNLVTQQNSWIQTLLLTIIPAVLILIILMKAVEYAKKGSGVLGEAIISGAKMATGLAIGATGLGVAAIGRSTIGQGAALLSRTDDAKHYGRARIEHNKELEAWEQRRKESKKNNQSFTENKPKWEDSRKKYEDKNNVKISGFSLGGMINASQLKSGQVDHARNEMDEIKKKAGLEGVPDAQLSGVEADKMKTTFVKEKRGDIESEIKRGYDTKGNVLMIDKNGKKVEKEEDSISESKFKSAERKNQTAEILGNRDEALRNGDAEVDVTTGELKLSKQGDKKVEDQLNTAFNKVLQDLGKKIGEQRFTHLQEEAQQQVGMGTRLMSRSTSGTYDVRNISSMKADRREGLGTKATVGLVAAVATGMRMGLKKGAGVEVGAPQGTILKDFGQTITEALKHVKIDVKLDSGGGHGAVVQGPAAHAHAPAEDSHGGGGHH